MYTTYLIHKSECSVIKKKFKKKKKFPPVMANFSALNQLSLVFLSYPKVSGNRKKPKRYYMADGGWI